MVKANNRILPALLKTLILSADYGLKLVETTKDASHLNEEVYIMR